MASRLLDVACWLAPGPTCQRLLGYALLFSVAGALLGALVYVLAGR